MQIKIIPYDEKNVAVSFPAGFSRSLLDAVRSLPGRRWISDEKLWLVPNTQKVLDTLIENIHSTGLFTFDDAPDDGIKKMQDILKAKNYSRRTIETYTKWMKSFFEKYGPVTDRVQERINEFLTELAVKKHVSPSTQNQALAALLFYFRFVKNENPVELASVIHAKKNERIPVVFSRQEVISVINNLTGSKRLAAELMYGTGMRLNEAVSLMWILA